MYKLLLSTCFSFLVLQSFAQFGTPEEITNNFNAKQIPVDFDLDGDIDLIGYNQNIFLFKNDGNGNFEKTPLTTSWKLDAFQNLAIGDLDGDSFPDILYSNQSSEVVIVLKNNGGSGLTEIQVPIENADIYSFTLMDVDSDSDLDLIGQLSSSANHLTIFKNEGNLSFVPSAYSFARPVRGFSDMNNDGRTDILLSGNGLQIKYNDGNGNFSDSTDIASLYTPGTSMQSFDFENDGDQDIIWKGGTTFYVGKNDGSNQFTMSTFTSSTNINNYIITDINYDGFNDLLVSNYSTYFQGYKLNDGNGNFGSDVSFNFTYSGTLTTANNDYYAVADFDNNGFDDVLIPGQILFKSTAPLTFNSGVKLFETEVGISMILFDANDDGIDDLVHPMTNKLVYQVGNPDGSFQQQYTLLSPITGYADQIYKLAVADINNDNKKDLFYHLPVQSQNPAVGFMINQGGGVFTNLSVASISNFGLISLTDLNNDNFLDIVYSSGNSVRWMKNNGNLTFAAAQFVYQGTPSGSYWFQTGDVNNDSNEDLLLMHYLSSVYDAKIILGDGTGDFSTLTPSLLFQNAPGFCARPYFDDLNNDGDLDLVYDYADPDISSFDHLGILLGDGTGSFILVSTPTAVLVSDFRIADINNDGLKDIISLESNTSVGVNFQLENNDFSDISLFSELAEVPIGNFVVTDNKDLIITSGSYDGYFQLENLFSSMVTAKVFVDQNDDGLLNGTDYSISNVSAHLMPDDSYGISNLNGNLVAYPLIDGTNQLEAPIIGYFDLSTNNSPYSFDNTGISDSVYHVEFGYAPAGNTEQVQLNVISGFPRCNTEIHNWISIKNIGSTLASGIIQYDLDSIQTFVSSGIPYDSIVGNTIYWHYDSLNYFEDQLIDVIVQNPDFNSMGDTMVSVLTAFSSDNANVYSDTLAQVLNCAYDPNDKTVQPQGIGEQGYIPVETEWLEYLVRFQNTGTDTAININVQDYLSQNLDWSSFTLIESSHLVNTSIDNHGKATFSFPHIFLPDSAANELQSHGFILYKIRLLQNLPNNSVIPNTANIYFDYNPAVVTNTAINTIYNCITPLFSGITPPASVCIYSEISVNVNGAANGTTSTWTLNNESVTGPSATFVVDQEGVNELTFGISNGLCSSDTVFQFSVNTYPVVSINAFAEDTLCESTGTVSLPTANPAGGTWSGSGVNNTVIQMTNLAPGVYYYSYEVETNGCSSLDSVSLTIEDCLGINELTGTGLKIYPNPSDGYFMIESETTISHIQIFDLKGQCVLTVSGEGNSMKLDLSQVESGIYVLKLNDSDIPVKVIRK